MQPSNVSKCKGACQRVALSSAAPQTAYNTASSVHPPHRVHDVGDGLRVGVVRAALHHRVPLQPHLEVVVGVVELLRRSAPQAFEQPDKPSHPLP